jgi:hypothetical protein
MRACKIKTLGYFPAPTSQRTAVASINYPENVLEEEGKNFGIVTMNQTQPWAIGHVCQRVLSDLRRMSTCRLYRKEPRNVIKFMTENRVVGRTLPQKWSLCLSMTTK